MKKILLCVALVSVGLLSSCVDKNEEVDPDHKPSWLGSSIYEALRNPDSDLLEGTFTNYLRLIDDLGYTETLSRTGSKTVFPANDEAFERFFQNNDWGVSSYDQLSLAQKKMLLNSSMLDNALLVAMLSNVSNGSTTSDGMALKHQTNVSIIDSITHLYGPSDMPVNNSYWTRYYNKGIDLVSDNTRPMLVHFTNAQMVNNAISTSGSGSDFEILTGAPYTDGAAYVFDDPIIHSDVTCQNGYIHQLQNVLVPPGNMPQVLRRNSETSLFSRVLDYYAVPYFDQVTTNQYNDWAVQNNQALKDSIFQLRYFSARSHGSSSTNTEAVTSDPDGHSLSGGTYLSWDPGWNQYYPSHANTSDLDYTITDIGAMFVPDNDAFEKYFLPGGDGAYLIDIYGSHDNTAANLAENLDDLYNQRPQVLTSFLTNLMKTSFVGTVPSKFTTITNDASENMGMNISKLAQNADGTYNIKIANNGVIYVLNDMIVPDEYRAVLAPSSSYPDMTIMNWLVSQSDASTRYLKVDFNKYLLSMSANYAFFIPENSAFDYYYIDPSSFGKAQQEALHIYYKEYNDPASATAAPQRRQVPLVIDVHNYNPTTGEISSTPTRTDIGSGTGVGGKVTQLVDILNYHTVILDEGEVIDGSRHYFQTKHGGEIYVSGSGAVGSQVGTDAQLQGPGPGMSNIKVIYPEANGRAYRVDHVIQSPTKSVYKVLSENSRFSEFLEACTGFESEELLTKAGISSDENDFGTTDQDRYIIFTSQLSTGKDKTPNACPDQNVKMFNTYNYTLYAPDNDAMEQAYAAGLPHWRDIESELAGYESAEEVPASVRDDARAKIDALRQFCRYHFQSGSLYADGTQSAERGQSLLTNSYGVADEYPAVSVSGGVISLTDGAGQTHTVNPASGLLSNLMTRDIWLGNTDGDGTTSPSARSSAQAIYTSSFCAVHEISTPFYLYTSGGQPSWNPSVVAAGAAKKAYRSQRHH